MKTIAFIRAAMRLAAGAALVVAPTVFAGDPPAQYAAHVVLVMLWVWQEHRQRAMRLPGRREWRRVWTHWSRQSAMAWVRCRRAGYAIAAVTKITRHSSLTCPPHNNTDERE